jgi:hypothetical protein
LRWGLFFQNVLYSIKGLQRQLLSSCCGRKERKMKTLS